MLEYCNFYGHRGSLEPASGPPNGQQPIAKGPDEDNPDSNRSPVEGGRRHWEGCRHDEDCCDEEDVADRDQVDDEGSCLAQVEWSRLE